MLTTETVDALADRLEAAEAGRTPMRHFTIDHPDMTVQDGYAVQARWMEKKREQGAVVRGHKIGLTSKAMRAAVGADDEFDRAFDDLLGGGKP